MAETKEIKLVEKNNTTTLSYYLTEFTLPTNQPHNTSYLR
jgi:hypothetical protein